MKGNLYLTAHISILYHIYRRIRFKQLDSEGRQRPGGEMLESIRMTTADPVGAAKTRPNEIDRCKAGKDKGGSRSLHAWLLTGYTNCWDLFFFAFLGAVR